MQYVRCIIVWTRLWTNSSIVFRELFMNLYAKLMAIYIFFLQSRQLLQEISFLYNYQGKFIFA